MRVHCHLQHAYKSHGFHGSYLAWSGFWCVLIRSVCADSQHQAATCDGNCDSISQQAVQSILYPPPQNQIIQCGCAQAEAIPITSAFVMHLLSSSSCFGFCFMYSHGSMPP